LKTIVRSPPPDCAFILLALSQQQPHGLYGNHQQRHGDNGHSDRARDHKQKLQAGWYPHPLDNPAIDQKCPPPVGSCSCVEKWPRYAFISNLMESGVEFEAVDFPQANRLTIHIMAAMAEHEAKMISDRAKAALAAAKRRGVKLGADRGARLTAQARAAGRAALQAKAQERADDLAATVKELQAAGAESLWAIAEGLEARGIPAARGGKWSAVQVSRLLARLPSPFEASAVVA
jgi:Resolvase, N terminal domain